MVNAGGVRDDNGGAFVSGSFLETLDGVLRVCTEVNLSNVHIAVVGEDQTEVLLRSSLARCSELYGCSDRSCFGGLSAGVGIELVVEHQHIEVEPGSHHVIQPAEANVVSPAITADHPDSLLGQCILAAFHIGNMFTVIICIGESHTNSIGEVYGMFILITVVEPCLKGCFQHLVFRGVNGCAGMHLGLLTKLVYRKADAESKFRIVFKQGIREGWAETAFGNCLREGRGKEAVSLGTAGSIGSIHPVSKELGEQLDIRGFTTARAGSGKLIKRLFILAALCRKAGHRVHFLRECQAVLPVFLFFKLGLQGNHGKSLFLSRADIGAASAALAVQRIDLNAVTKCFKSLSNGFFGYAAERSCGSFRFREEEGADGCVRAHEGTAVTSDALGRIPNRHIVCHTAFFEAGGVDGHNTVCIVFEGADRQQITLCSVHGNQDFAYIFRELFIRDANFVFQRSPALRDFNLHCISQTALNGSEVHVDDLFTLLREGLDGGVFHILFRLFNRQDAGELEEGRLQHRAGTIAEADFRCNTCCVDGIEVCLTLSQNAFCTVGEIGFQLLALPVRVEQEGTARFHFIRDIKGVHVTLLMAGNKVCHSHIIGAANRFMAKAQMASCETAGLLGIILEVSLYILVGIVSDDLAGIFVCTDGSVRPKPPELAGDNALASCDDVFTYRQGSVCYVIDNTDGEVILLLTFHVVIDSFDLSRSSILRAQAVTAAEQADTGPATLQDSGAHVFVQRFTESTWFLGTVERGKHFAAFGNCSEQMLHRERPIEVDLNEADLFSLRVEVFHYFACRLTDGAHRNDHTVGIGCSVIVEELIVAPGECGHFVHILFYDTWESIVIRVCCFSVLEKYIVVFTAVTDSRVLRVQCAVAELSQFSIVNHIPQIVIVQYIDLLNLMAGAETVKEMLYSHVTLNGREVRYRSKIHALLYAGRSYLCPAGLTAGHHVLMVAEDRDGGRCHTARCDMHDSREQKASNAVHRGDHQHQTLRRCIRSRQCACFRSSLQCTAGAAFRLHFH